MSKVVIWFEGPVGSGKSILMTQIKEFLKSKGHDANISNCPFNGHYLLIDVNRDALQTALQEIRSDSELPPKL